MSWTNFHTHSNYCDGTENMERYVEEAIKRNISILGFSGHAPVFFPAEWAIKTTELDNYFEELDYLKQKYAGKIKLYKSLEIDFIKGETGPAKFDVCKLDYTIGSVHFLKKFQNGTPFAFDQDPDKFEEGLYSVFQGDIRSMVEYYYAQMTEMLKTDKPDILGHFDLIKKYNRHQIYFNEQDNWYRDLVVETLNEVEHAGCVLEVNTRGVYRGLCDEFYPSRWILKHAKELEIPVMINSDAHHPSELDSHFSIVAQQLLSLDFKEVRIPIEGRWKDCSYTKDGIMLDE